MYKRQVVDKCKYYKRLWIQTHIHTCPLHIYIYIYIHNIASPSSDLYEHNVEATRVHMYGLMKLQFQLTDNP